MCAPAVVALAACAARKTETFPGTPPGWHTSCLWFNCPPGLVCAGGALSKDARRCHLPCASALDCPPDMHCPRRDEIYDAPPNVCYPNYPDMKTCDGGTVRIRTQEPDGGPVEYGHAGPDGGPLVYDLCDEKPASGAE